jgi:hypothetical protein
MTLLIVAIFWLLLFGLLGFRWTKQNRHERSIDDFQVEHKALRSQGYRVAPARMLEDEQPLDDVMPKAARPRLRVVRDTDTSATLAADGSWDEWSRDYEFEAPVAHQSAEPVVAKAAVTPTVPTSRNRYAAYAVAPTATTMIAPPEPPLRRVSMQQRRQRITVALVGGGLFFSVVNLLAGITMVQDLAIIDWVCFGLYAALAFYAVSQGYLEASSLGLHAFAKLSGVRLPSLPARQRRPRLVAVATEPVANESDEFFDADETWERESAAVAFG